MGDLQDQIDALAELVKANRTDIESLTHRAEAAEARADAAEARANAADTRVDIDREMIAELHRDGVVSRQHAEQMEEALRSSRTIGAAIGLIMGSRQVSDTEAFDVLKLASQNSNRKLRELAAELVAGVHA